MPTRIEVAARFEMPIAIEDDVILVRRQVRSVAQQCGFDTFATAAIMTAASELGRNVWTHARGGTATIERISDGDRSGLQVEFRDQGPGIEDLNRALAGGFSSVRSLGLGLSGSRRLVDEFDIQSAPGKGTIVKVRKWARI